MVKVHLKISHCLNRQVRAAEQENEISNRVHYKEKCTELSRQNELLAQTVHWILNLCICVFFFFFLQTSIQNLPVVLQHAAVGRARAGPRALHHPHGFRGTVLLHRPLCDGRRGAREAGRKKEPLWRRSYRRALVAILIGGSVKAAGRWIVRGVSSDKGKQGGCSHV